MKFDFQRLTEVRHSDLMELMNHPRVRAQMPLLRGHFGIRECAEFVAAKERLWAEHGYGPWAIFLAGRFVGWGGLQAENGEADLALVLHPDRWGLGKALFEEILARAFGGMGIEALTVLLPPTRKKVKALFRLGFRQDGELLIGDELFIRYRLNKAPAE